MEGVRNRRLVHDAKKYFKNQRGGKLKCEVCDMRFAEVYATRGAEFIEAHHRVPVARLKKVTKLKIHDLAMVCANCHRMLHRQPWISVEKLREEFLKRKREQAMRTLREPVTRERTGTGR